MPPLKFYTGCEPEPNDPRDLLGISQISPIPQKKKMDWVTEGLMSPVKDQSTTNCCTGEGTIGLLESLKIIKKGEVLDFSELFTYYNARSFSGTEKYDGGAFIRDALKSLNHQGACYEKYWPFSLPNVMKKPNWLAYFGARFNRINRYYKLYSKTEIMQCLSQKIPCVGGIFVYDNISEARHNGGYIPLPKSTSKKLGGHCQQIGGYDSIKQQIKWKGSWGKDFGDKGYLYTNYDFMDKFSFDWWGTE